MKRNDFLNAAALRVAAGFPKLSRGFMVGLFLLLSLVLFGSQVFASGGSEGGGINPLNWRTDLAIWTAVVFVCLLLILSKFAFGPIAKALDEREESMKNQLASADKANVDARELLHQYQQKLDNSQEEVRQMLEVAKSDAAVVAQGIVETAKGVADDQRKRALADIESATDGALKDLATMGAELATSLAGKILKERIDPQKHAELIQGALSHLSTKQG